MLEYNIRDEVEARLRKYLSNGTGATLMGKFYEMKDPEQVEDFVKWYMSIFEKLINVSDF